MIHFSLAIMNQVGMLSEGRIKCTREAILISEVELSGFVQRPIFLVPENSTFNNEGEQMRKEQEE